jgi:acetyl esterase/lipase
MKSVNSRHFSLLVLLASAATLAAQTPDNVQVTPDIVYATYGARQLKLDIYRPLSSKPLPGIVVIRGGGWRVGDKHGFAAIARNLAARGFVTACIEYRVLPDVQFPDPVYDTKAAVRWMRAEGGHYGINTDEIGAIGGSAGGHLVALLGTSYQAAALEGAGGHPGVSSRVQAVVAMAPVTDFAVFGKSGDKDGSGAGKAVKTMFQDNVELANSFSPVTYLSKDSAPILFIHGDADKTVPISQSEEMLERCKKVGVRASLISLKDVPHGFWNNPKWAADTITQAADFFHDVLGH